MLDQSQPSSKELVVQRKWQPTTGALALATFAGLVMTLVLASPAPADRTSRTETRDYSRHLLDWEHARCGGGGIKGGVGVGSLRIPFDPPRSDERLIDVVIEDGIPGQRVLAVVNQARARAYWGGEVVCGRTSGPLRVRPERPIFVHLLGGLSDAGPSVISGGTVKVTYYRTPSAVLTEPKR
jgi:hypothetical protein